MVRESKDTRGGTRALWQMLGTLLLQLGLTAWWVDHTTHIFMSDLSLWWPALWQVPRHGMKDVGQGHCFFPMPLLFQPPHTVYNTAFAYLFLQAGS